MKGFSEVIPQTHRIWGINWKILPIKNKSYPTITGRFGIKYTDPIVNVKFPIKRQSARNAPIFLKGLNILNSGYMKEVAKSFKTSKTDPIVKRSPPAAGLTFVNDGQ